VTTPRSGSTGDWDGATYQQRFDELAASGQDPHGEARYVMTFDPVTVLDGGCGTGRVAIELSRRGADVVGVDVDTSMLAEARRRAPSLSWMHRDLADLDLGRTFDVVVLAGNVLLFTIEGTQASVVAGCGRHVGSGVLIAGFSLDRGYDIASYDGHCAAAGLHLVERWSTWDGDPYGDGDTYAVSVHRRIEATSPRE
jgi:SAM-dependent methyltransferase